MRRIRSSTWWIAVTASTAAVFFLAVYLLTFWGWEGGTAAPYERPIVISPTTEPSGGPTDFQHPAPLASKPFGADVVESVGPGWFLVEYDTGSGFYRPVADALTPESASPTAGPSPSPGAEPPAGNETWVWDTPGPRILYVVDPTGQLWAGADLGEDVRYRLLAWLPDYRTAIIAEPIGEGTTRAYLRSVDLVTGELSGRFDGPDGTPAGAWSNPEVRPISESVLVADRGDVMRVVELSNAGDYVDERLAAADGQSWLVTPFDYLVVVGEDFDESGTDTRVTVTYSQDLPDDAPAGTAAATVRIDHGRPAAELRCDPVAWPLDRQLLVACEAGVNATTVWTLAPATSTFAQVVTIPWDATDGVFALNDDATRIAVSRVVFDLSGAAVWVVATSEPQALAAVWSGDALALWGDSADQPVYGFGQQSVRVHDGTSGDVTFTLEAFPGAGGFLAVLAAP